MINPRPDFELGAAVPADIDAMDRIEREAFNTPWSRDLLHAAISNETYRVRGLRSRHEGLLGFYIAHAVQGRSNLDNLAVERTLRGRGYGSELIEDWIAHARGDRLEALTLQVNTANAGAQKLYERFHFHTARLLVAYYPNGDDAYQMELELKTAPELRPAPSSRRYWLRPPRSPAGSR